MSEDEAREHAGRLELRACSQDEIAIRDEYLRLLGLAPGDRVLEVGCGSGAVVRALVQRVAPARVVGVDASAALINVARELAQKEGFGTLTEFQTADCRALPFSDNAFDAVLAVTTLSHVPEVDKAIREMIRVTRPGGRLGVFDIDGDSFVIPHPDRDLTRRIVAAFSDHGLVNGWLMRSLGGILRGHGLTDVHTRGFMPLDTSGYYANAARRVADIALEARAITREERDNWLVKLEEQFASKRFVSGRLHLFVWGARQ